MRKEQQKKPSADEMAIAIRQKCLECSGYMRNLVDECLIPDCPLYKYRSIKAIELNEAEKEREREGVETLKGQISIMEV